MKSLYESILDDIDVSLAKGDEIALDKAINDPATSKLWKILDLSRADVGRKYPIKYEDKTLYVPRSFVQNAGIMQPLSDAINYDVDHLVVGGMLYIRDSGRDRIFSGDKFCRKITCGYGLKIDSYKIKDLDLRVGCLDDIGVKKFPSSKNYTCFDGVISIENVTWESDTNIGITFEVDEIPDIKNCTFKNLKTINIYSPFLFDNEKLTKEIQSKWMLPKYDYTYKGKTGDEVVTIKNFKKLHAVLNQPKKYNTLYSGTIKPFKDNIKASDIIPWINTIPGLQTVVLKNNNIKIYLHKDVGVVVSYVSAITTDGWHIMLAKNSD